MKNCTITFREWLEEIDCPTIPVYANDEECKICKWYKEV